MSVKAMTAVFGESRTSGNERLMLLAIADCADDTGRNAWPSMASLARKCNIDVRTARRVLARLARDGHLVIDRGAGRRGTNVYHLTLPSGWLRTAAFDGETAGSSVFHSRGRSVRGRNATGGETPAGVLPEGVAQLRPEGAGATVSGEGWHSCASRTSVLPVPPPPAGEPMPRAEPGAVNDGGGVAEFFSMLGAGWPLGGPQRERLAPLAAAALRTGWQPRALAAQVSANTAGVRNPYAVLRTRLTELPAPPAAVATPARPPWCGHCDQRTRLRERADSPAARCPSCHPLVATATASNSDEPVREANG